MLTSECTATAPLDTIGQCRCRDFYDRFDHHRISFPRCPSKKYVASIPWGCLVGWGLLACKVHRVTGLNAKFPKILFVFGDLASFTNLAMASIVTGGFEKALLNLKTVRSSAGESFFALPSSSAKYQLISGQ